MPEPFKYAGERKSHQSLNEAYFRTSVINDWKHLLKDDEMKMIVKCRVRTPARKKASKRKRYSLFSTSVPGGTIFKYQFIAKPCSVGGNLKLTSCEL